MRYCYLTIGGILTVLYGFFSCCQNEPGLGPILHGPQTEGTKQMAYLLDSLSNMADPNFCYFLNSEKAETIKQEILQTTDPNKQFQLKFKYGIQLLQAGKTNDAIKELTEILRLFGDLNSVKKSKNTKTLLEMLAIAYMRLGEQQNCVINHKASSCIIPFSKEAQHTKTHGSEKAIQIYTKILTDYPNDYQSKWLINFAYMTIGKYPDDVPDAWLISPDNFEPKSQHISPFNNVAIPLGLDVEGLSGGCVIEDFNNDGHLDIFMSSYGLKDQVRLFLSNQNGKYTDNTVQAGLTGITGGLNLNHADYNNDGFYDILILRGGWFNEGGKFPNSLLKNNGDGTFSDVSIESGIISFKPTQTAAWADFNSDGFLDLFIGNESTTNSKNESELFANNGDGTFTEISSKIGLQVNAFVKGTAWGDINNDQLPDLYISTLQGPNYLYVNRGGNSLQDWKFEEIAEKAGVQRPIFSFPTWFFDYNNDGFEDIFVSSYDMRMLGNIAGDFGAEYTGVRSNSELSKLYRNNGDETFTDVTGAAGLEVLTYGMGSNYGDLDNDGYLDFYIGSGEPDLRAIVPNRMFKNIEGLHFEEVTMSGFGHIQKGHAIAFGDLDRDGDQDIYCVIGGAFEGDISQNVLFENPNITNKWITVSLQGKSINKAAVGSKIKVKVKDNNGSIRDIYSTVSTGGSFGSSSMQQEIGLGNAESILSLTIIWQKPGIEPSVYENIKLNSYIKIIEGEKEIVYLKYQPVRFKY